MEYVSIKDSLNSQETRADIVHLEDEFRYQQKAIGDSLITVEKERVALERAASDAKIRYALFAGLGLTLIFGVVMFNRFRTTRRQKNLISKQQVETERQKRLIEAKNKEITDSINYAQRIQQAILPPETELKKAFTDIFVLFKPRDIVSGDFYWYEHSKTNRVIALADCTGHGVPGGFMSMLGYEMLQESVMLEEVTTTSEALRRLDRKVTTTLNKNDRSYRDGMDLALCAFSKNKMELQYSGANRPLIHISAGLSAIYKPDKHTIGGAIDDVTKEFTSHTISLAKGDMIYLFSDGYADQFGGPNGKKFMTRKFEQLLLSIAPLDCSQQKMKLETTFKEWKGTLEQVDDVCVVGIRI
jgi:serine phosphatase RsbU (regulator of sigma subunit)